MQKTIYIKDEERWGQVKDAAQKLGMGIGEYLLGSRQKVVAPDIDQLDRIESKIDKILSYRSPLVDDIPKRHKGVMGEHDKTDDGPNVQKDVVSELTGDLTTDAKILAAGQAKLDAVRKGRNIKKDVIARGSFNPQPKGK